MMAKMLENINAEISPNVYIKQVARQVEFLADSTATHEA